MNFRELRRTLANKLGASEDRSGDHIFYYLNIKDSYHKVGKISHSARGSDTVVDYIVSDTAKRLKLNKNELVQLIDCSVNRDDHLKLWQERTSTN